MQGPVTIHALRSALYFRLLGQHRHRQKPASGTGKNPACLSSLARTCSDAAAACPPGSLNVL